jgi:uncharacterized protein YcaQ
VTIHELSRQEARRIAVRAQLLQRSRPATLLDVVGRLTLIQVDTTAAVAPSADLVLWSRLGSAYKPTELTRALDDRTLIELRGMIRPREDIALYRAEMHRWADGGEGLSDWELRQTSWVEANGGCRSDILSRLEAAGPLPLSELPDTCRVKWGSSGWNDNRNLTMMLEFMAKRGEVAIAGRDGRDRLWDLAERVYPDEIVPEPEAARIRAQRWLRGLGIARPTDVGEIGEPAVIDGVRGRWRVDPEQLGRTFAGRAALLSPLDRLVFDRKRVLEVFAYDYALEMYKPFAKRRWGYYALPILYGDDLVGKLDATADRRTGVLRVDAIHQDVPFAPEMTNAVNREIRELARWLKLDPVLPAPARG